jgi:hypothetical protein
VSITAGWAAVGIGAATGLAGLTAWAWRTGLRMHRRATDFFDDWAGAPGRPGVRARAGVMERLGHLEAGVADIQAETKPNSGDSLRDVVQLVRDEQAAVRAELATFRGTAGA